MKKQMLSLIIGAAFLSPVMADVKIETDRAVIDPNLDLTARVCFPAPDQGDLYVAALIDGVLYFYGENGQFSPDPVPYRQDGQYDANQCLPLFTFPGELVPGGRYILYSIVTDTGADPYDFTRWHGPLGRQLFIAHEPPETSGDHDGDGWPDDDDDRNGFSDYWDRDYDGWRDDDEDRDGYSDMDHDRDGWRDDDSDRDGVPDDDDERGVPPSGGQNEASLTRGEALYAEHCAGCHGADPAVDGRNSIYEAAKAYEILEAIAKNKGGMGVLSSTIGMPEAEDIAAFVRSKLSSR